MFVLQLTEYRIKDARNFIPQVMKNSLLQQSKMFSPGALRY